MTKEQLRDAFDETHVVSMLYFVKDSPIKLSQEQGMLAIRRFGDFVQEMGIRGIPITEFRYEPARSIAAAERLNLSAEVICWFTDLETRHR